MSNVEKRFPNAVFGCGHLSPIGWCGACARIPLGNGSEISLDDGESLEEAVDELDACERGGEYTETDDE